MSAKEALGAAPGRGQYDRRLPRERRLAEQRERLLAATALAVAHEESPAVASIVRRAGVGRNTFYEYFDDVEHAVAASKTAVVRRLEQWVSDAEGLARTPVERWRALAHTWLAFAEEEPSAMLLVLSVNERSAFGISSGARVLEAALGRSLDTLRQAGVTAPPAGPDRVLAVAAAGEAFARAIARASLPAEGDDSAATPAPRAPLERDRYERSLVDVAVRLLR